MPTFGGAEDEAGADGNVDAQWLHDSEQAGYPQATRRSRRAVWALRQFDPRGYVSIADEQEEDHPRIPY